MSFIISTPSNDFDKWLNSFVNFLARKFEIPARPSGAGETLAEAVEEWAQRYKACIEAQGAAEAARAAKDQTRGMIEEIARHYTERLEKICAQQAARPGLKCAAEEAVQRPVLSKMEVCTPLVVGLFFVEVCERNAMPAGVQFCEVRCRVGGEHPESAESLPLMALETRPPYRADFAANQAGQTAWLAFRWVKADGEAGAWSEIYAVVVPG